MTMNYRPTQTEIDDQIAEISNRVMRHHAKRVHDFAERVIRRELGIHGPATHEYLAASAIANGIWIVQAGGPKSLYRTITAWQGTRQIGRLY